MKSLLAVAFVLAGGLAQGDDCRFAVSGKVVAVPDGGSVWVYVEQAQASYHVALAGIQAPAVDQPSGQLARNALCRLVLGQEVCVKFDVLCCEQETVTASVYLKGHSVNNQMARLLTPTPIQPQVAIVHVQPPHRPLLGVYFALRQILPLLPGRD
jgi:hypothetical protein